MLVSKRTLVPLGVLLVAWLASAQTGESPSWGCDPLTEQPCRSNSSLCVPLQNVGDGYIDCPDGSDEDCPDGWFVCDDRSACVAPDLLQDGVPDCLDESDEVCEDWQHECLCGFPRCIDSSLVEDGVLDCLEGSDELAIDKDTYICPSEFEEGQELRRKRRQANAQVPVTPCTLSTSPSPSPSSPPVILLTNNGDSTEVRTVIIDATPTSSPVDDDQPTGLLRSSVGTFINDGTTSEYVTLVHGTYVKDQYTQVTSTSSRIFFSLPTRLAGGKPEGLMSTDVETHVNDYTTTYLTTRYLRTHIDGTYAQVLETLTDVNSNVPLSPTAPVRIPVHGTFFTQSPSGQHAKLEVSLKDGVFNPDPVGDEIVTLMGTQGQFIKEGATHATTYNIFTGSYVKELRTYLFFFGNTALPTGDMAPVEPMHTEVVVKKGGVQSKILVDMEKDLQVIMPSKTHSIDATVAPDLLMGEGMIDGRKMGGVFIEGSEGFEMEGAQSQSGETSMLTITIGRPVAHTRVIQPSSVVDPVEVTVLSMEEKMQNTNDVDNEIDGSLLKARKVHLTGDEIIADLQPSSPLTVHLPTFTIDHSNVPLEAVVGSKNTAKSIGKSVSEGHKQSSEREGKSIQDIRDRFNLETGGDDSDLPTVTYVGFADFTTTIADTVVVFTPRSGSPNKLIKPQITATKEVTPTRVLNPTLETKAPEVTSLAPRLATSRRTEEEVIVGTQTPELKSEKAASQDANDEIYSTVSTKRFNSIDLYPTGLVSSIGGTIVQSDMTTLLTTFVYGTYIQGQYAQIVQSTSSIFYLVPMSSTQSIQATKTFDTIETTENYDYPDPTTEFYDIYNYDYDGATTEDLPPKIFEEIIDNALGRSVASGASKQHIVDTDKKPEAAVTSDPVNDLVDVTTLTFYTTYLKDGETTVSTRLETSTVLRPLLLTPASTREATSVEETEMPSTAELTTYTFYTTLFVDGSSTISSRTEVHTKSVGESFQETSTTVSSPVLPTYTTDLLAATITSDSPGDFAVVEAVSIDDYDLTTESVTESVTESISESMSESSTDSSAQDVTEAPGFALDSSLNPEEEVSSSFLPRTYYTTYTYFTTFYRSGTSSIVSSLETQTNVVTDPDDQEKHKTLTPEVPSYPVTYYTTFTYWTTYFQENRTSSISSEKTISNVVTPTAQPTAIFEVTPTTTASPVFVSTTKSSTPAVTTFYTTYTYYTSTYIGESTIVNSRLETKTEVVTATPAVPVFATTVDESHKATPTKSTGLLSTIRGSTVVDGTTTVFSTDIIGTVVDGLYAQIQSTTSFIIAPTTTSTPIFPLSTPEEETTKEPQPIFTFPFATEETTEEPQPIFTFPFATEETTTEPQPIFTFPFPTEETTTSKTSPFFFFHTTTEETTETDPVFLLTTSEKSDTTSTSLLLFTLFSEETATESETLPFVLFTTTTKETPDHLDTIEEMLSSIAENVRDAPTSRPELLATPALDSSLNDAITESSLVESATEALLEDDVTTDQPEEDVFVPFITSKSKLQLASSFPGFTRRPSGSRTRPDIFPFIRRSSSFRQWSATVTQTGLTPTVTATPASNSDQTSRDFSSSRRFRFGGASSTVHQRFRFTSGSPSVDLSVGRTSSPRPGSTSPFRFASGTSTLRGSSSPGGFRFSGPRSSAFPGTAKTISPTSVFQGFTTTAAPESDLIIIDDEEDSTSDSAGVSGRPFGFRPKQQTRSSIPFTLFNRRPSTTRQSVSRFTPKLKDKPVEVVTEEDPEPTTEAPASSSSFRRQALGERRNRFNRRPDLSKLFPRRDRPLQNEASEHEPVYVEAGGRRLTPEELDEILSQAVETPLSRTKRQVFGARQSRGNNRNDPPPDTSRRRGSRPTARVSPSPPQSRNESPFTLTPNRGRSRSRTPVAPKPAENTRETSETTRQTSENTRQTSGNKRQTTRARGATPERARQTPKTSNSRTSLPQRPRPSSTRSAVPLGNIRGRGFRRPSTDNNFRPSNKFSTNRDTPIKVPSRSPVRRPTLTSSRGTTRNTNNNNRNTQSENPITAFRNKPAPEITTDPPAIFPSDDGGFLIQEEITVTREIPVKATIPVVEDGQTLQKEVITASLQTEIIQPDQITQSTIDGTVRLVLSTFDGEKDITHYVVDPIETTSVTHTRTFIGGRRTSVPVELPTTAYNVITVTEAKAGGDIQQLLSLLLGQQQQNPLLAALGLGQPMTSERVHTRSYVTTVTNHISQVVPVILRGRTIQTTIVDSEVKVITATELSTETIITQNTASPFIQPNPLNQLLPILLQGQLQQQSPQVRPTREPSVDTQSVTPQMLEQLLKQQEKAKQEVPTPSPPTPSPVETSIVTLYVSGKRPGEFSTLLSTVTLSGDSTRIKRGSLGDVDLQPTVLPHYIETDKGLFQLPETYNPDDMDWFVMSAMNEIDTNEISKVTPSLESVLGNMNQYTYQDPEGISSKMNPFLWEGPAELTPLKRNVRSAQRGEAENHGELRVAGARKIQDGTRQQIVERPILGQFNIPGLRFQSRLISEQIQQLQAPTTFYTTFTYYTTLVDDIGNEYVQSSEETITQLATHGNVRFDDFTRIAGESPLLSSVPIQAKFTINDAIIPGRPRPVPDPVFEEPNPPFGPVIRHDDHRPPFQPVDTRELPELQPLDPSGPTQEKPSGRKVPPAVAAQSTPEQNLLENQNVAEDAVNSEQNSRRIVLTRRRPISQPSTDERRRIVITRKRPVDQEDPQDVVVPVEQPISTEEVVPAAQASDFLIDDFKKVENGDLQVNDIQGTLKATHEIMEMEEQDQEEEIPGVPGSSRRVRVTVTKRRPVQLTNTLDIADKTTTLSGGRRRVVVTRRLPQPTVVASEVRPLVATVNTFYTVYSYLYTLYENQTPFSVSTREVTVSNQIDPTVISVLPTFHTGRASTGLYTLETGNNVATLGERVLDSLTTQIFLASATLINITPEAVKQNTKQEQTILPEIVTEPTLNSPTTSPTILQSSLAEDEVVATNTPILTTSSFRATQRGQQTLVRQRGRGETRLVAGDVTATEPTASLPSRAGVRNRGRGTVRFVDNRHQSRITVTRRRPVAPATQDPAPVDDTNEAFLETVDYIDSPQEEIVESSTPEPPRRRERPTTESSGSPKRVPEDTPQAPQDTRRPSVFGRPGSRRQPETRFRERVTPQPTEEPVTEEAETEPPVTEAPTPAPTPTRPTRPPRTSIRRDDIPIIRRPGSSRPSRPFVHQEEPETPTLSLRFTPSPEPDIQPTDPPQPLEVDPLEPEIPTDDYYNDDYYYDDYYYDEYTDDYPLEETTGEELPPVEESSSATPVDDSTTVSSSRPRFVRPTRLTITTSTFDIIEALKRERTYTQIVAPTRTRGQETRRRTRTQEPSTTSSMASNVVYSTYATTTLIPILGGEQSVTLTILTSTLTTLAEDEIHLITDSPELFDPALTTTTTEAPSLSVPLLSFSSVSLSPTATVAESPDVAPTLSLLAEDEVGSDTEFQVSPTLLAPEQSSSRAFAFGGSLAGIGGSEHGSGRAVGGESGSNQLGFLESSQGDPSGQRLGARFSVGARHNLATKVMSNGVQVIVAGDKTASPLPQEQVITNNLDKFRRPITLPPSTLSDQMLLFASQEPDQAAGEVGRHSRRLDQRHSHWRVPGRPTGRPQVTPDPVESLLALLSSQGFFGSPKPSGGSSSVPSSHQNLPDVPGLAGPEVPSVPLKVVTDPALLQSQTLLHTVTYLTEMAGSGDMTRVEVVSKVVSHHPANSVGSVTPRVTAQVTQLAGGDDGSFQTNTYFTTYTYYNTLMAGNRPFVITSKQTVQNIVTVPLPDAGSFIEKTEVTFDTETYYTTQTFTRTLAEGADEQVVTSQEVLTQVVITEAPSVERSTVLPTSTSLITKTYFTTLTYYNTAQDGQISSDTVVSSEVVTETTYVTPTPSLNDGILSLTPTPALQADGDELVVYATKTLYTTLTYLTTILEGRETITASRIEVSSNIVTEPLASALSSEELVSIKNSYLSNQLKPTAAVAPEPQTVMYVHIRDNLYKQLRTFFATFTHYTTMAGGLVHSRLETRTKVLTSTVTTNSVPASLLIRPTAAFEPIFPTSLVSSPGPSLQLDPSYLSSLKSSFLAGQPSVGDSSEEGLIATVLVEEGDASGTFVVSDSTTSATLLVRPTDEPSTSSISGQTIVIVDSAHLSSLKSSYLASLSSQVISVSPPTPVVTGSPTPIITTPENEGDGDSVTAPTNTEGTEDESSGPGEVPTTTRPDIPDVFPILAAAPGDQTSSGSGSGSGSGTSGTASGDSSSAPVEGSSGGISITGSGNNGLNIDLGPMLTAVAGILRSNLNSQIAAKSDDNRRKIISPLRPPNTLISSQREPLLIPVGGVGASLSSSRDHTEGPEHGFIPLKRPQSPETQPRFPGGQEPPRGAPELNTNPGFIKIVPGRPRTELPGRDIPIHIDDMEKFGPTFLPPQKTQSGFTAITTESLGPTRVSVISGSQTIFFGDVNLDDLPPPGRPAPSTVEGVNFDRTNLFLQPSQPVIFEGTRPVPVPVRVQAPGDGGPIPLLVTPNSQEDQQAEGDSLRPSPQRPQPSRVGPTTIVSIEGDNRIVGTQTVHARPVETYRPEPSIIVSPARGEFVLHSTVGIGILSSDSGDDENRPRPPPGLEGTVLTGVETILVGNGADNGRTTVVRGSSTVMSGATTIFEPLFTRPAASNEPLGDLTSVVTGPGGILTRYITRVETEQRTITATRTDVLFTAGVTSTETQVIRSTLPLRTIVTTIVGTETRVNYATKIASAFPSGDPTTYPPGSPFDPANYPSFPLDGQPEIRLPENDDVILNEASLGIAEDNEISRVVESKSPDQEINVGGPLRAPVSPCDPQCSASRHEVCRLVRGAHTCVCRPGYARRKSADACKPSAAYNVQILLDRLNEDQLIFDSVLHNASHPLTIDLENEAIFGINEAMLGSKLAPRYHTATITKFMDTKETAMPASIAHMDHGLIAEVKVEIARGESYGDEFEEEILSESIVKEALESSLRNTNYSLGSSQLFANRAVSILAADDFNECSSVDHNDCSDNAYCTNTVGSFLCLCRDGYKDMDDMPGRHCAVQTEQCAYCSFQGECIEKADGTYGCRCLQWFSGKQCQINLRVLLIVLVSVGSLLILLLLLCLVLCCLRARRNTRNKLGQMPGAPTFLRARGAGMGSTLDRRAMIHETSSESSIEHNRSPPTSFMAPPPPSSSEKPERPPRPPRSDISASRHSRMSFAEDRSVGLHTTLPPVLIPRVKGPAPRRPSVVSRGENGEPRVMIGADTRSDLAASQQAFVDLLDQPAASIAPTHHGRNSRRESVAAASIHSSNARINRSRSQSRERLADSFLHGHHHHHQGSMRSRSSDRLHQSAHDLHSEFGVSFSFRHDGERSEARSYDETTVRPPVRTAGPESFYSSKALSSQHISDEHQTMAERDGGSTLVYPQTELYRPVRDTDSLSDMSDHHSKAASSRAASRNFFS